MKKYLISCVFFAVLLGGCATSPPASSTFTNASPLVPVVHQKSGFSFPVRVAGFQRGKTRQYDTVGEDVSVGYGNDVTNVYATVFVYPTHGRTLDVEFAARQAEVKQVNANAQLVAASKVKVTPKQIEALFAIYSFVGNMGETSQPLGSELVVAQSGEHFVEYRFTYPIAAQPAAIKEIGDFEREFVWP